MDCPYPTMEPITCNGHSGLDGSQSPTARPPTSSGLIPPLSPVSLPSSHDQESVVDYFIIYPCIPPPATHCSHYWLPGIIHVLERSPRLRLHDRIECFAYTNALTSSRVQMTGSNQDSVEHDCVLY